MMTQVWESEKDKLIEQLRDQYRGQQWAKSKKYSPFRGDSSDLWLHPNGVTLGEIQLTGRLFTRLGIAFGFVLAVSTGWLMAGGEIWSGYQEVQRGSVPSSSWGAGGSLRASLPTIAFSGQEIVVHYQMKSDAVAGPYTSFSQIGISCLCPSSDWEKYRIVASGEGKFVFTVKHSGLHNISIYQSSGNNGTPTFGIYWWGIRNMI